MLTYHNGVKEEVLKNNRLEYVCVGEKEMLRL